MAPPNPAACKLFRMVRPTDVGRGLAPTSATERGANSRARRYVLMDCVVRLHAIHYRAIHASFVLSVMYDESAL